MLRFHTALIGILFIACVLFSDVSRAAETVVVDDGFKAEVKTKSRYFNIYIKGGVDIQGLTMKLAVPPSIRSIIREPADFLGSYTLYDQLDTFFLAVLEIMDIRLKKFKCTLKICKDASQLSDVAKKLFGRKVKAGGFYVAGIDTIYVDAEDVTIEILGHELSHAIQVHYFVVPPPEKIQEILAGYVEYQLRKYTNTLPR